MISIEERCKRRSFSGFVAPETIDLLAEKMFGIIGDRRMTKMHRYLGEQSGIPRLFPGLRVWTGGLGTSTTLHSGLFASISLANRSHPFESLGFSVYLSDDSEEEAASRYHDSEKRWLGQRRDVTLVELRGWPGECGRDDQIRIEYWNSNGVGQEIIIVFDDVSPIQELAWDVKGDKERQSYMDEEFCTVHGLHYEDLAHSYSGFGCEFRPATLAENLKLLADLVSSKQNVVDKK